jgi:hypothetical protein
LNDVKSFYESYSFESWVNAAYEVAELVRIYNGLQGDSSTDLILKLKEVAKGQELYIADSSNRSGRDFSFELSIAAKFASAGLAVDLGHEADLKVILI